jgi:ABC-2 type transport system permease protein
MTAQAGQLPQASRTPISTWSRIYGLGSVYAKTLRDSRLSFIIVAGTLAILMLTSAIGFGEAYATLASRQQLAKLVADLPPVLTGIYGNPFPMNITSLGGSIAWKSGGSFGLITALWSLFALSGTLAAEARRGSLDFVAATPLGKRRIATEKVAAHITAMTLVAIIVALTTYVSAAAFGTLPDDSISLEASIAFGLWVGLVGLASGAVAFALSPFLGRAASAGIAGVIVVIGYFVNGYQGSVPAFAGPANLTWWGWTAHFQPLAGSYNWIDLLPLLLVPVILLPVGIVAFTRRDLGATSRIPWPGMPRWTLGLGSPLTRSLGERLPIAIAWGIGIAIAGFVLGAAASSFGDELAKQAPEVMKVFQQVFPNIDFGTAAGFLQLTFVQFGIIFAGFAAATLIAGWASDEASGRAEMLLAAPLRRVPWVVQSGLGVLAAVVVMTIVIAIGIGFGASVGGGGIATPVVGTAALGLYAAALCGIGFAVGGIFGAGFAGEIVAGIVILTFLIDLVVPALKLPDWMHQLALTAHFGQPMVGNWDVGGIVLMLVFAFGGLALGAWGVQRRDLAK